MPSETVEESTTPTVPRAGSGGFVLAGVPLLAAVYFVGGKLGLRMALMNVSATTVWPPTGIALAALLIFGLRLWPGVFLGALLVNMTTSGSWGASLGIASGNTLEGILGCVLVEKLAGGRRAFESVANVVRFTVCAPVLSTMVSATCGVGSLLAAGLEQWPQAGSVWITWWLGDMGGALVVAPLLIVWSSREPIPWNLPRVGEGLALAALLILLEILVFRGWTSQSSRSFGIGFLTIPGVLWASFRFKSRGTSAVVILLSAAALWGTVTASASLSRETRMEALVLLQAFLAVVSITALAVSAAVEERRRATDRVAGQLEELARLNHLLDSQKDEIRTYHSLLTHDISNVAMAMLGLVERLLLQVDGPLTPKQEDLIRRSNRQALQMNRMGENARMLVRIREQGLPPPNGPVEVRDALDRALRQVRDLHFDRLFDVHVDCPQGLKVRNLPFLDSILINLLDNGVRHTPRTSSPVLNVRVKPANGTMRIVIEGGSPPPPEVVSQLLEPSIGRNQSSGHGIGLVLVREVLQRAGGTIAVRTVRHEDQTVFEVDLSVPKD
jgi:integral membrane sensor domain MASE1